MALVHTGQKVLFLADQQSPKASEFKALITTQTGEGLVSSLDFSESSSIASLKESEYDVIVSLAPNSTHHVQALFLDLWKSLKPNGKVVLLEAFERSFEHSSTLFNSLTVSGFTSHTTSDYNGIVTVTSNKPNFTTGATHAIKLKKKEKVVEDAWSKGVTGDAELIDEASLLTEVDLAKPILSDECEVGATKKACKNCSCGRAEMEAGGTAVAKPKVTLSMLENPAVNSGCGNCALGDAFRCGGCPYAGLPSFKPGEKIVLPSDFDMDLIEDDM